MGERRWRAARELELAEAPVIVREATDREVLEQAIIENLVREDLNPVEEATAYGRLHKDFGMTQEAVAKRVAKSRAYVANALRLLSLPDDVLGHLKTGRLTVGHAKVLLSLRTKEEQSAMAEEIVRKGLSVRVCEKLAAGAPDSRTGKSGAKKLPPVSPAIQRVQNLLTHKLTTRVVVSHAEKRGVISIEYYGVDDLNRILGELGIGEE
jgi:ParB family chromosome partitioning protein